MTNEDPAVTVPGRDQEGIRERVSALLLTPEIVDAKTGKRWVHKDYVIAEESYAHENHAAPEAGTIALGDVESLAAYVKRYGSVTNTFARWNGKGITATLDYHDPEPSLDDTPPAPGLNQWHATYPFVLTTEWVEWTRLADGQPKAHQAVIEFLENHFEDIDIPAAAELADLLRSMRGAVNKTATSAVNRDGTTKIAATDDRTVDVTLPAEFRIAIPALKGHARLIQRPVLDAEGRATGENEELVVPVKQELSVFLRVFVGEGGKLSFRFHIPGAERALERVMLGRVEQAKEALGPDYPILRAAD